jgi:hypothetical protein
LYLALEVDLKSAADQGAHPSVTCGRVRPDHTSK